MTRVLSILRALNPVALLLGPTFQKEMRSAGRRRGTYWLRGLYAAGLLGIVAIVFSGMRDVLSGKSSLERAQALQVVAPTMTFVVAWFQFIAMVLISPMITAPVVCEERRQGTLAALLTTPLTSGQIALGKLASRVVQLIILSLLSTPLLLAIRVFGGLDTEIVLAAACISVSTAILGAALGVLHSVWHRRPAPAALSALLALALIQGGPLALTLLILLTTRDDMGGPADFPWGMVTTCAPAALGITGYAGIAGGGPPVSLRALWVGNTLYNLGWAALITTFTAVALRRAMVREASHGGGEGSAGPSRRERRAARRAAASPADTPSDTPAPDAPHAVIEADRRDRVVGDHPVLWREVRAGSFGSRRNFYVVAGITGAILLLLYWRIGFDADELHATIAIIGALAVMVQSVFLTTGGSTGERESRTWDVLLCTPLTGRQVILGKFAGALKTQWFLPAVVAGHMLVAVLGGFIHPMVVPHVLLTLGGPILLFTALGVLLSLCFRRSTAAAVCNIALGVGLWGGSWLVAGLSMWAFGLDWEDWYQGVWQFCFAINPVAMVVAAADGAGGPMTSGGRIGPGTYYVLDARFNWSGFTALVIGVFLGYAALAGAALAVAVRRFTALSGRAS